MSEPDGLSPAEIPEHLMLSRLARCEQMRKFFIQMWIQNAVLARQGASKTQSLLPPLAVDNAVISPDSPTGFTADIGGVGKLMAFWLGENVVCPILFPPSVELIP